MLETQSERFVEFPTEKEIKEARRQNTLAKHGGGHDESSALPAAAAAGGKLSHASSFSQDKRHNWTRTSQKSINEPKNYLLGTISAHPVLDLRGDSLVSINDAGHGYLCRLMLNGGHRLSGVNGGPPTPTDARGKTGGSRAEAEPPAAGLLGRGIVFETVKEFQLGRRWAERGGSFISVVIAADHGVFMTAQQAGRVTIFNLHTGDKLCCLNQ